MNELNETLKNMLENVKKRPGMYLGAKSLTPLHHYIDGYCHALSDLSGKIFTFGRFVDFLHEKHPNLFLKSYWPWWEAILRNTSSEEEAVDYFFVLLEEFWREKL